jgi:AcrR family transcriptional regulator
VGSTETIAEQAAATRNAVLAAARELFVSNRYTATTMAEIADRAQVSADTVFATVGRKSALLRELVESAISGTEQAVPAEQRDYVAQIRAATSALDKITIYGPRDHRHSAAHGTGLSGVAGRRRHRFPGAAIERFLGQAASRA